MKDLVWKFLAVCGLILAVPLVAKAIAWGVMVYTLYLEWIFGW